MGDVAVSRVAKKRKKPAYALSTGTVPAIRQSLSVRSPGPERQPARPSRLPSEEKFIGAAAELAHYDTDRQTVYILSAAAR